MVALGNHVNYVIPETYVLRKLYNLRYSCDVCLRKLCRLRHFRDVCLRKACKLRHVGDVCLRKPCKLYYFCDVCFKKQANCGFCDTCLRKAFNLFTFNDFWPRLQKSTKWSQRAPIWALSSLLFRSRQNESQKVRLKHFLALVGFRCRQNNWI